MSTALSIGSGHESDFARSQSVSFTRRPIRDTNNLPAVHHHMKDEEFNGLEQLEQVVAMTDDGEIDCEFRIGDQ
jgi:hypothetical protein